MTKFMNMRVPILDTGAEQFVVDDGIVMSVELKDCAQSVETTAQLPTGRRGSHEQPKPFEISKWDAVRVLSARKCHGLEFRFESFWIKVCYHFCQNII